MNKYLCVSVFVGLCLLAFAPSSKAGIERIDVSPMVLVNLSETPSDAADSRFLGGAVATDLFFSSHFGFRTTIGYVKNKYDNSISRIDRYFVDADPVYTEGSNYSLRLSVAPYAEANIVGLRPYLTFIGGYSYSESGGEIADIRQIQTGALSNSRYIADERPGNDLFDLSVSAGIKIPIAQRLAIFGEIQHRIYSNYSEGTYYDPVTEYRAVPYGFDSYPTFISLGLTYSIPLKRD